MNLNISLGIFDIEILISIVKVVKGFEKSITAFLIK